jgi:hypothetical protein
LKKILVYLGYLIQPCIKKSDNFQSFFFPPNILEFFCLM